MNLGKLDVVKQEIARINIDILGISELKWTGMGKLYAEYIMWKAGLEESQTGIKTAGRNINNLRYADDTTLMAESEEELKNLFMRVKEESAKNGLKINIKKTNIMATGPINSWQIERDDVVAVTNLLSLSP